MRRPERLWEQYQGKAVAEAMRGSAQWPLQPHPCDLDPPWDPYDRKTVSMWDCMVNQWEGPWEGNFFRRLLLPGRAVVPRNEAVLLPALRLPNPDELQPIVVEQFPDDVSTIPKSEEFLRSLVGLGHPLAFEIIGMGPQPEFDPEKSRALVAAGRSRELSKAIRSWTDPYIVAQFVAHRADARRIERQLLAHFPNSAVVLHNSLQDHDTEASNGLRHGPGYGAMLCLSDGYCYPLRVFTKLDPDPLGVAIAAMEHLGKYEWAMLQVLFMPTFQAWHETLGAAISLPYGNDLFIPITESTLRQKFGSPLFAVSVRIAAKTQDAFAHLEGWGEQFSSPPQSLRCIRSDPDDESIEEIENDLLADDLCLRCTHRPGMLLNISELVSLVHLPGSTIASECLRRVKTRTRAAAVISEHDGSVVLGENTHRGKTRVARLPAKLRARHCYIAGASGTGKSTLLLNMIVQDIEAGQGVGVLDPHGDLVADVLKRIPEHRVNDVILFDPTDKEYPFGLNILDAKDFTEAERIVTETVMALERYFPSSWGPRLEQILTSTLYTVLNAIPGATLADVERMLTDPVFRDQTVANTKDQRLVDYWRQQYAFGPKNAADPVLNKLSVFLINRTVRNIICQRRLKLDFDELLNDGKILLANLSTGLLSEKISGTLGSFIITKIVNAAFRRASILESQRRPWHLYIDEFQAFMNLSAGFDRILTEARKFKLVLTMANQFVGQLDSAVRQAIFGTVGTMVVFRLGVEDASSIARELDVFTTNEVLNLRMGEAIVRPEVAAATFNLKTTPAPPLTEPDFTKRIIATTRVRFASSRERVETELGKRQPPDPPAQGNSQKNRKGPKPKSPPKRPASDPNEEDLVN